MTGRKEKDTGYPGGRVPYSGLHLYEEAVLGFPLPLRERDRVRGKAVATNLLIQTKSAVRTPICLIFLTYPTGIRRPIFSRLSPLTYGGSSLTCRRIGEECL